MSAVKITIVGGPGAGKSTLAQNLAFHLERNGQDVRLMERECGFKAQEIIGAELRGKKSIEIVVADPALDPATCAKDLLTELRYAQGIIKNALNLMTMEQKVEWDRMNEREGVDGEGITRAYEGRALIRRAEGLL